jgi:hypothetical protein
VPNHDLAATSTLPIAGSTRMIRFPNLPEKYGEMAIVIERPGGHNVLVTCDCLQSHEVSRGNFATRWLAPYMGFHGKYCFGPIWLKMMRENMDDPSKLADDMRQLTVGDYRYMLTGHGYVMGEDIRAGIQAAFDKLFPAPSS